MYHKQNIKYILYEIKVPGRILPLNQCCGVGARDARSRIILLELGAVQQRDSGSELDVQHFFKTDLKVAYFSHSHLRRF
jgi:hypothetical protein